MHLFTSLDLANIKIEKLVIHYPTSPLDHSKQTIILIQVRWHRTLIVPQVYALSVKWLSLFLIVSHSRLYQLKKHCCRFLLPFISQKKYHTPDRFLLRSINKGVIMLLCWVLLLYLHRKLYVRTAKFVSATFQNY